MPHCPELVVAHPAVSVTIHFKENLEEAKGKTVEREWDWGREVDDVGEVGEEFPR